MNTISRRALLGTSINASVATGLMLALSGCGSILPTIPTVTPAQVISTAATVAKGLAGAIQQVQAAFPSLIPAALAAQISGDLALAEQAAGTLSGNLPAAQGASTVKTVEGYINAVLTTLAGPPINGLIPAPFNMAVAAAAMLVPQLEAFVAIYIPSAAASPASMQAKVMLIGAAPVMSSDQALAVLKSYAGG